MAKAQSDESPLGWGWFLFKFFALTSLLLLAACGALAIIVLHNHRDVLPDTPTTRYIAKIFELYGPPVLAALKFAIQSGGFAIFSLAMLIAMMKIDKVARIVSNFLDAKGDIHSLVTAVERMSKQAEAVSLHSTKLVQMKSIIDETSAKIEDAIKQISELQRIAVSERIEATSPSDNAPIREGTDSTLSSNKDNDNWEALREIWNSNGARLDDVISRISSRRRREKFVRMPKTRYPDIINGLATEGFISNVARDASLRLHQTFMSYKPRNRPIPDQVVADMSVLNDMLAEEMSKTEPAGQAPRLESTVDNATVGAN